MDPADYLREHGGPDLGSGGDDPADLDDVAVRRAAVADRTRGVLVASTLTVGEAASGMGVSAGHVRRRIAAGSLWTVEVDGEQRVPGWQIDADGETLPGLRVIVPAIPAGLHPLAVESFMTTPRPDFDGQAPVQWLTRGGGDPDVVAAWLEGLGRA